MTIFKTMTKGQTSRKTYNKVQTPNSLTHTEHRTEPVTANTTRLLVTEQKHQYINIIQIYFLHNINTKTKLVLKILCMRNLKELQV